MLACLALLFQVMAPSWAQSSDDLDIRALLCAPGGMDAKTVSEAEALLADFYKNSGADAPIDDGHFEHCPDCLGNQHIALATVVIAGKALRFSQRNIEQPALYIGQAHTRGPPLGERAPPSFS